MEKKYKMTIITPSYRINNLQEIKKSLNFDYIDEWIIVYDGNKIESNPNIFNGNEKIREYVYKGEESQVIHNEITHYLKLQMKTHYYTI